MSTFLDLRTGRRFTLDPRRTDLLLRAIIADKPRGIAARLLVDGDPLDDWATEHPTGDP